MVGKVPLGAVGAPTVYGDRSGMIKIVGDKKYGELLGGHIVSVKAADLIQELVNAHELEGGYPRGRPHDPPPSGVRRGGHGGRPGHGRVVDSRLRATVESRPPWSLTPGIPLHVVGAAVPDEVPRRLREVPSPWFARVGLRQTSRPFRQSTPLFMILERQRYGLRRLPPTGLLRSYFDFLSLNWG